MKKIITQIGSLPLTDVKQAVGYSLKHDIPFLPELPKLGDAMLEYIKHPGKMSCLEEFKKHDFDTVKIQCVGPTTLMLSGYKEDEAVAKICEHVTEVTDGLRAKETILFLDEPALGQVGFDYRKIWDALFSSFKVTSGIHTCGNMNWDDMFDSKIDIISFDASQFDITKYSKYRNGKRIAWGVKRKEDIKDFKEGDLITLPCGMGTPVYKPEDCQKKLKELREIASAYEK